jgi:hypothetical protein
METRVHEIRNWMAAKHLKINDSKSEFINIAFKSILKSLPVNNVLRIGNDISSAEECVKSLGVILDKYISMENYITATRRTAFYHLCNIGRIRKYLSYESCEQLIHAFITSRMDYCNALFFNLLKRLLN